MAVQDCEEVCYAGFATIDNSDTPALVEHMRLFFEYGVDLMAHRVESVLHRRVVLDEPRDQRDLGNLVEERVAKVHATTHIGRPRRAVLEEPTRALLAGGTAEQKYIAICVWSSFLSTVFYFPFSRRFACKHALFSSLQCSRARTAFSRSLGFAQA